VSDKPVAKISKNQIKFKVKPRLEEKVKKPETTSEQFMKLMTTGNHFEKEFNDM
jgi:hypothetical protein